MRRTEGGLSRAVHAFACGVTCLALACTRGESASDTTRPAMAFDSARVRLISGSETTTVRVELAKDSAQQKMGLMERRSLAPDAGMLFLFDSIQPKEGGFWMYRTRIPLDIAYIDSAGVIGSIVAMEPCTAVLIDGCPSYTAGVPYRATLEVGRGFFRDHRLAVGDRVMLGDAGARP